MPFEPKEIQLRELKYYVPFTYKGELCVMTELGASTITLRRVMKAGSLGQAREIGKLAFSPSDCLTVSDKYTIRMVKYQGGLHPNNIQK
jgi:hypothetical protein